MLSDRLVALAQLQPGHKVVDLASGLGEPVFTAARQVGATGRMDPYGLSVVMKSC